MAPANEEITFGYPEFWPQVHEAHRAFFQAAHKLEGLSNEILSAAESKATQPVEKVVLMLVRITTIGLSELVTLVGNGCGPGGMKISRGMFESATAAEYLRQNPQEVQDYLDFRHVIMWRRHQWQLKSSPNEAKQINPDRVKEIEDDFNRVKSRFMDSRGRVRHQWSQKSIGEMARDVGRGEQYDLPYSFGASIHHANAEGMLAYIQGEGEKVVLDAPPSMSWVPQALVSGHTYVLQALDTLNECCELGFDEKIKAATQDFKEVWRTP